MPHKQSTKWKQINAVSKELRLERANSWRRGYVLKLYHGMLQSPSLPWSRCWICHTRPPPTKDSVMSHLVSQFPPLAPNLATVSNYKQPKAGVSHLVSQPPPDPSHLDIVSTMEIFSTWGKGSPHPQHTDMTPLHTKNEGSPPRRLPHLHRKSTKTLRPLGR